MMFIVAFSAAWLANAGIYTLFLDGVLLTLHRHLTGV
jgi:hypothetical protein